VPRKVTVTRRSFDDLLKAIDGLTMENMKDNLPLIRDAVRDLGRRLCVVEGMLFVGNHDDHMPLRLY
jgi:hypothetical protein